MNFENAMHTKSNTVFSFRINMYFRFTFHLSKTEYDTLLQTIGTNNLKGHVTDFNHIFWTVYLRCVYIWLVLIHRFLLLQIVAFSFGSIAIIMWWISWLCLMLNIFAEILRPVVKFGNAFPQGAGKRARALFRNIHLKVASNWVKL